MLYGCALDMQETRKQQNYIRMNGKKTCFSSILATGQQGLKIKGKISKQAYRIVNTVINVITIKMKVRLARRTRNACVGCIPKGTSLSLCSVLVFWLMYSLEFFRTVECRKGWCILLDRLMEAVDSKMRRE